MGLLLVRHADAVEGGDGIDDAARWLSSRGRARAQQTAQLLTEKNLRFDSFVTSPRVRAVQTAELFARALGFDGEIQVLPSLSYTEPAKDAVRALARLSGNVAAFGHMPTIGEILHLLCSKTRAAGFQTSEAVWVEHNAVSWRVVAS